MPDSAQQITGVIGDPSSWKVVDLGGELVLVDVPGRPGAKQKMSKEQAITLGLWKDEERGAKAEERKAIPAGKNKARRQAPNK